MNTPSSLLRGVTLVALGLSIAPATLAAPAIDIVKRLSWDVVGLDSNDESKGPDTFAIGYRACNSGDMTATDVVSNFYWDSSNDYIDLATGTPAQIDIQSIDPGDCYDIYYNVEIDRVDAARETSRDYHITVSASGAADVSTPIDGSVSSIYVENLISQNRNSINSISGPDTVYQWGRYQFVLNGRTATQGYEQLEAFIDFPNNIFRIISVSATYSSGGGNDAIYADACGWEHDPASPNYFTNGTNDACATNDKAGGDIELTYEVEIIGTGSATVSALIYDFSGSSFHYNTDYGIEVLSITALAAPTISIAGASVTEGDSGTTNLDFTLRLSAATDRNVTASYSTTADSAVSGVDFIAVSGSATISAGDTEITVTVPVIGDLDIEGDETLTFTVTGADGATIGTGQATGTILDDDAFQPPIDVTIADTSAAEGGVLAFGVALSAPSLEAITITFRPTAGTAGPGDFTTDDIQITIPPGDTTAVVNVPTTADTETEGDETLTLYVQSVDVGTLGDTSDTATGTIIDGATGGDGTNGGTATPGNAHPVPTMGTGALALLSAVLVLTAGRWGRINRL